MKNRWFVVRISLIIVIALSALILGAGYYFSGLVIKPKVWKPEDTLPNELKNNMFTQAWYDSIPKRPLTIESPNGYSLNAVYVPGSSNKTVIFVHGHTYTLDGGYKYLELFRKHGFNALLFDSRFHGKSGGENSTFGKYEKNDLAACVDYVKSLHGEKALIGVHGESMGAAICLLHAADEGACGFYIVDGAISDLRSLLAYKLKKQFGLPGFPLINSASLMSRLRGAMFFGEISPVMIINRSKAAMFFIHGANDQETPPENSEKLFVEYNGPKQIWLCPGAGHSKSIVTDRAEYEKQVDLFLKEKGFI